MALPSARSTLFRVLTERQFPREPRAALSAHHVGVALVLHHQKQRIRGTCKTRVPRRTYAADLDQTRSHHHLRQEQALQQHELQLQQVRLVLPSAAAWEPAVLQISEQVLRILHPG